MLYTELIRLWDEAVRAVDNQDWDGALAKLVQISEPTSRTLFVSAAVHLALGQLDQAIKALDMVIAKDERLAVGFFQRSAVHMMADRLDEALGDCVNAQKHMRSNSVIDYKQLGLRYRLYSWQVLYNAAAVHCRTGEWDKAANFLVAASQERGGRGSQVDAAMDSVTKKEVIPPLTVPEGVVFRPRKQYVEELQPRDFLGKAEVIISDIPNDDFGGFEPLRLQKPGYYEPKVEDGQDSRYMCVKTAYTGRTADELTVPAGVLVFVFSDDDTDGLTTVIYDGKRGLLPNSLLEPVTKKTKGKKNKEVNSSMTPSENTRNFGVTFDNQLRFSAHIAKLTRSCRYLLYNIKRIRPFLPRGATQNLPSGIPLPPSMKPPTRPQVASSDPTTDLTPSYASSTQASPVPQHSGVTQNSAPQTKGGESVVVKVHYTYTISMSVPLETPYRELKERIAQKLGQPAELIRLRHKQHGSSVLTPMEEEGGLKGLTEVAESGRATLWCQAEDPLASRTILYQMVALYDYTAQGPEDLEFSEGDTIDILSEVNEEWLEGHTAGNIGIFPRCFAYRDTSENVTDSDATAQPNVK